MHINNLLHKWNGHCLSHIPLRKMSTNSVKTAWKERQRCLNGEAVCHQKPHLSCISCGDECRSCSVTTATNNPGFSLKTDKLFYKNRACNSEQCVCVCVFKKRGLCPEFLHGESPGRRCAQGLLLEKVFSHWLDSRAPREKETAKPTWGKHLCNPTTAECIASAHGATSNSSISVEIHSRPPTMSFNVITHRHSTI